MGRAPCCDKASVKKGPWSPEEDSKLKDYIDKFGTGGNWIALPQKAGLKRCGKSCRLRWLNYLRPNIKHGEFSDEEDRIIFSLFVTIGSRWSIIAAQLPGRTDNDIKNYWNTKLKKKLMGMIPPSQRKQLINIPPLFSSSSPTQISSQSLVPSQLSLSIPSLYKDFTSFSPYTTPGPTTNRSSSETSSSFTGLEFLSLPSNNPFAHDNSCTSSLTTLFQDQEGFLCPIPYDTSVKDHNSGSSNNMLVFGSGDQRSDCSSSDGTCNRQMVIDYGRDQIKQEQMDHHHHMHISSSNNNSYNNGVVTSGFEESHEQQQRVVGCGYANSGYLFGENNNNNNSVLGLGYDLEDVKRLISSSSSSLFSTDHESKTEEKAMAMYYF